MNEQAREAVAALRMLVDCKENPKPCDYCSQEYFDGKLACHPIPHFYEALADLIESMVAELEQVKREREAAIRDMAVIKFCAVCRNDDTKDKLPFACTSCGSGKQNWRWRGLCKENGGIAWK